MRLLPRREGLPWSATLSYLNDMRDGVPDHRFRGKGAALQLLLERFFPCPQLCFFLYGEKGGGAKTWMSGVVEESGCFTTPMANHETYIFNEGTLFGQTRTVGFQAGVGYVVDKDKERRGRN